MSVKDLEARVAKLEAGPVFDKKLLALKKEVTAYGQHVGQLAQDGSDLLVEMRRTKEEIDKALHEFQKLLENQHIQRLINSGVF
jgi:hypothetical protein